MQLVAIDWFVVALYGAIAVLVGLVFARRAGRGTQEFFLSGRKAPWWLLGTSMVATTFSTDTPNLVTDMVRTGGVSQNWLWWAFLITGMCTVFFYAKLWRRSGAFTDIGFYELRYSGDVAAFLRGFRALYLGVFFNVMIMAAVTLAAIKIAGVLLGVDKYTTVLVAGTVTVIYSATSGLWGVVVTDLLLFAIAMVGSLAAAYYAVVQPEVGGLAGLVSHPALEGKLSLLPDFSDWRVALPVFLIPIAVQWWSVWYPGAEPGGGGYVAQRMLAARDERDSMRATLWFNIAHYALRPWPWIIVALASLIVYPNLEAITARFPGLDPSIVRHDLAYPAMLVFLPHGLLGLVVASLAAAYMSTISTHLNWGASYIVDDFYRRFLCVDGAAHRSGDDGVAVAGERAAGVPDSAADRRRHGAHLPIALVLVADQRLERALGDGHLFLRRRLLRVLPPGARVRGAPPVVEARARRRHHHGRLADGDAHDAAHRPLHLAGVLRPDPAVQLGLASRCGDGTDGGEPYGGTALLVPGLRGGLRGALRDGVPAVRACGGRSGVLGDRAARRDGTTP
jgi:Na+/proline symporter